MTNNVSFQLIVVASRTTALTTGGSEVKIAVKLTTTAENGPPTVDTSGHERAPPSHLATQAMPYPTIIPAAISGTLCDTAAAELKDTVAVKEQDPAAQLELTSTCAGIAREAHKVSLFTFLSSSLVRLRTPTDTWRPRKQFRRGQLSALLLEHSQFSRTDSGASAATRNPQKCVFCYRAHDIECRNWDPEFLSKKEQPRRTRTSCGTQAWRRHHMPRRRGEPDGRR